MAVHAAYRREKSRPALEAVLGGMQLTRADHLPILAAFCRRIGLLETIDRLVPSQREISLGTILQGMVLDTLAGRSPLYRLADFFQHQDTALLLGPGVPATAFNDTTVGRVLDAVFAAGAERVFTEVAFRAASEFPLDLRHVHFDTTSVSVWGDYDGCVPGSDKLNVTYGKSKDHRPDLKQFLMKMLCVGRNVPILGGCEDGNASDKTLNNRLLTRLSQHLARHGLKPGAFLYIADSALVTENNLAAMGDNRFLTRLPFSYGEAQRAVSEAVAAGNWEEVGVLNETPTSAKRPPAHYRIAENTVTLYEQPYRALVAHSTAHDKRRLKRLQRQLNESKAALAKVVAQASKQEFFCRPDAESAAARLHAAGTELHGIDASITEKVRYAPGRPPKNRPRKVTSRYYVLDLRVREKSEQLQRKQEEAGCFVLLTNVPCQGENAETGPELLRAYKDLYGIERNYSFLKDPLIVNDLFVKKPERLEALGAVLLMALLLWNLIEHVLRQHVETHGVTLPGWDNKPTRRPTAFMMSTKFFGLQLIKADSLRQFATPLTPVQRLYLDALSLSERDLLDPYSALR